jgi:hypothetical protein
MKIVMNLVIVLFIAVALAACQKANNPVSSNSLNKTNLNTMGITDQNYNGRFEVTYKDYRNTNQDVTMTGSINFVFKKSTYSYDAVITDVPDAVTEEFLHDSGTYEFNDHDNGISLADNATKTMTAGWKSSLYLSGNYIYRHTGDQTTIEGNGRFGTIKIVLQAPLVEGK